MLDFPNTPNVGQEFTALNTTWQWDGQKWTALGSGVPGTSGAPPSIEIGSSPPINPIPGDFWWDTNSGNLFVWYDDGTSQQWVPSMAESGGTSGSYLSTGGGALTGPLTLAGNATSALQAVPLQQLHVVSVLDYGAKGDGTTNDTTAIQNVLNAQAGKAIVYIPVTGSAFRTGQLTLPSFTHLILDGTLQALPGLPGGYVVANSANNIIISGSGTIDANGAAQTSVGGMAGLGLSACADCRVTGITIQNAYHWNINITQSNNMMFDGITLIGGGAANEIAAGCYNCWLTNSIIDGTNNGDYGFCFYGGVHDSGAIGNTVMNTGKNTNYGPPGIGVMNDTAQRALCSNIVVANNVCHHCAAGGITILGQSSSINTGIIVANNQCHDNCQNSAPAGQIADCFCNYTNGLTISGNQFTSGLANAGIYLGPSITHANVVGNQIYNMSGGGNPAAMWINSAAHVFVNGNYFYRGTASSMYAVVGALGAGCVVTNNYFEASFSATTASDSVVANYAPTSFTVTAGRLAVGSQPVGYSNSAGIARWYVGNTGSTESGSNTGSDFGIYSVIDSGASLLGNPLLITRQTGIVTLSAGLSITGTGGIKFNNSNVFAFTWNGSAATMMVDRSNQGFILTTSWMGANTVTMRPPTFTPLPGNYANDAAAATGGVPVGGTYRNGSALMVRTV